MIEMRRDRTVPARAGQRNAHVAGAAWQQFVDVCVTCRMCWPTVMGWTEASP
jgi:hypothetical protein